MRRCRRRTSELDAALQFLVLGLVVLRERERHGVVDGLPLVLGNVGVQLGAREIQRRTQVRLGNVLECGLEQTHNDCSTHRIDRSVSKAHLFQE